MNNDNDTQPKKESRHGGFISASTLSAYTVQTAVNNAYGKRMITQYQQVALECPKHGKYFGKLAWTKDTVTGKVERFPKADYCACPMCEEENKAQDLKEQDRSRALIAERLANASLQNAFYSKSNMPQAYYGVSFEDVIEHDPSITQAKAEAKVLVDHYPKLKGKGVGLCLFGAVGTGKTMLAMAIFNELFKRYGSSISMRYIEMWRIFQLEKQSWTNQSRTELERLQTYDVLVIDEIGVQVGSLFEERVLMDLLNRRVNNKAITIYISNLNPNSSNPNERTIYAVLGERVFQRLSFNTRFLPFRGESQRAPLGSLLDLVNEDDQNEEDANRAP